MAKPRSIARKGKAKAKASSPVVTTTKVKQVLDPLTSLASGFQQRIHEIVAVQRQAIKARRGSYRAAMNPRTRLQTPYGGSGDMHADAWSRRMLRELSRDMDRNADTFGVLHDAFASAVVGEGVKYRPTSSDPEWNKIVAKKMDAKLRLDQGGIDVRDVRTGYRIGYDLIRAYAVDGECAALMLDGYKVQCFEAEQITDGAKSNLDGVTIIESGKIVSLHIVSYDLMGRLAYDEGDEYDIKDVLWFTNKSRFSQTRGVPLIVAGIDDWERLDSFRESEIIAAEQGSQIYGAIEHPEGSIGTSRPFAGTAQNPGQTLRGGIVAGADGTGSQVDWQPTVAGAIIDMPDGKVYKPIDPARPNPNAVPFMMELIRQFCAKAGLPYEFVYNDVRGLSWSVNRALVQMARDRIAIWQTQTFAPLFSRLYTWILQGMIDSGEIAGREDWASHELQWSQISWPDEGAEYEAQSNGLLKGLTTRHRVHGPLWRDMLDERAVELAYASELAKKHNATFKDFPVTPQFFLGFEGEISKTETDNTSQTMVNGESVASKAKNVSRKEEP